MERFHEYELELFIEDLLDHGIAKIKWTKIYRWYGIERMSQKAHRDLYRRIADKAEADNSEKVDIEVSWINNYGYAVFMVRERIEDYSGTYGK